MQYNQVLLGDCLQSLKYLKNGEVDLIYLDPPFFTQKAHTLSSKEGDFYSFDDSWKDILEYKNYIQERLIECKRVLKDTGSLFLHCDKSASHYLRVALDKVFGYKNFQSEIIWTYKRWSNSKIGLLNSHQVIFFYSKSKDFKFRQKYEDYSPSTNLDQIFQERQKNKNGKTVYKKNKDGKAVLNQNKKGVPLGDVWDIPYLNPKAKERVGYPTQKPILLLERIIELVTDEKDLVLDPFCGSGTTLVASKILNRKYLGFDKSQEAVNLSKERLLKPIKTESKLLKKGRKSYLNQNPKILEILKKIGAVPVQRNKGIDGFLTENGKILPVPIKIQRENEDLQVAKINLLNACKNQNYANSILFTVKDEKETGLFTENSQQTMFNKINIKKLSDI